MAPLHGFTQVRRRLLGQARLARQLARQAELLSRTAVRCSRTLRGRLRRKPRRCVGTSSTRSCVPEEAEAQSSNSGQDEPLRQKSQRNLSLHWLSSADFLELAMQAGLQADNATWMDNFESLCAESETVDPGVNADLFVKLVMNDLARHCQLTSNSLQEMLQVAQAPVQSAGSCLESTCIASKYESQDSRQGHVPQAPTPSHTPGKTSAADASLDSMADRDVDVEGSSWQPMAMAQLPIRLKVWPEEDQKEDSSEEDQSEEGQSKEGTPILKVWDQHKSNCKVKRALSRQKGADEDINFDPIMGPSASNGSVEVTDWQFALQGIFNS